MLNKTSRRTRFLGLMALFFFIVSIFVVIDYFLPPNYKFLHITGISPYTNKELSQKYLDKAEEIKNRDKDCNIFQSAKDACKATNTKRFNKYVNYLKKAAEFNSDTALVELGYIHGKDILEIPSDGLNPFYLDNWLYDLNKKHEFYLRASNLQNGYASYQLALMNEKGELYAQDNELAIVLYEKAGNEGYGEGFFKIATFYHDGVNVEQDREKALAYYQKGCLAEYQYACDSENVLLDQLDAKKLAKNYYENSDFDVAKLWYERLSKESDLNAMNVLATMYRYGRGTSMDKDKAIELFTRSAELGNAHAFYFLADIYENGDYEFTERHQLAYGVRFIDSRYFENTRSILLYTESCDKNSIHGCFRMVRYYEKRCSKSNQVACEKYNAHEKKVLTLFEDSSTSSYYNNYPMLPYVKRY